MKIRDIWRSKLEVTNNTFFWLKQLIVPNINFLVLCTFKITKFFFYISVLLNIFIKYYILGWYLANSYDHCFVKIVKSNSLPVTNHASIYKIKSYLNFEVTCHFGLFEDRFNIKGPHLLRLNIAWHTISTQAICSLLYLKSCLMV